MAKIKRKGVRDIERHINRFLNSQLKGVHPSQGIKDSIDFSKFKGRGYHKHDKGAFITDGEGHYYTITNNIGTKSKPMNRQMVIASLFNDPNKPFEHLNNDILFKLIKRAKQQQK